MEIVMSTGVNTVENTFRIQFNDEFKQDFDRTQALLRKTVRSNGVAMGQFARFDIVDPSDESHERGRDGRIPISQLGLSQVTATIQEHYKKYQIDSFDLFRNNPTTRTAMAARGVGSVNKAIDNVIIQELDSTTNQVSGTGAALSTLSAVTNWLVQLWENDVPQDGKVWGVITPRAKMQMLKINEYKSRDFTEVMPLDKQMTGPNDYFSWLGVKWFTHTGLTGAKSNNASCYVYHEDAIGHMIDGDPEMRVYYVEDEDRYACWVRARHAARVCLPRGVVRFRHDDTAAL